MSAIAWGRIDLLFHAHPTTGQLVHGGIQVVLVEILAGLVQAAGASQERAPGVIDQSQLGIGKELRS